MSSLLEQLQVKPVSGTKQKVKIVIPVEGIEKVRVRPRIIDRTGEEFDRSVIMAKLKRRGLSVPKMKQQAKIRVLTKALMDDEDTKDDDEEAVVEVPKVKPRIKLKKLGKVKISRLGLQDNYMFQGETFECLIFRPIGRGIYTFD